MTPLVVVLAPAVWALLAAAFPPSPFAPERGYCATDWARRHDTLFVRAADTAAVHQATPLGVAFTCPSGALPIHTHPLARCSVNLWFCQLDPALPCSPSAADRATGVVGVVACRDGRAVAYTADTTEAR